MFGWEEVDFAAIKVGQAYCCPPADVRAAATGDTL
jgi:hypothetical protein